MVEECPKIHSFAIPAEAGLVEECPKIRSFAIPAEAGLVEECPKIHSFAIPAEAGIHSIKLFLVCLFLLLSCHSASAVDNEILARQNYILNCQGCHLPDGSGSEGSVPKMNDFVGYFLHVPGGREFLVRVPGAAGAPISDQELADVMNWILLNFSKNELPDPFVPYNAEEIGELRKQPLIEMHQHREELLTQIKDKLGITEH